MPQVNLLIGTKKGAFIVESDAARENWKVSGPYCDKWPMNHVGYDAKRGAILGAGGDAWFGPAVWRSTDWGKTWSHSSEGIKYPEGVDGITTAWVVKQVGDALYLGVDPAGLFRSDDGGETWTELSSLREHETRPLWGPGAAGLILHGVVPNPDNEQEIWIAISSVGIFHTADGGQTWTPQNKGIRNDFEPEMKQQEAIVGFCPHRLVMSSGGPDLLFQRNHLGVYRSRDRGASWEDITAGLPTDFGFAAAAHPREPETFWLIPLTDPFSGRFFVDGEAAVYKTADAGTTYTKLTNGLPTENAFTGVMRGAMAVDTADSVGVYFGTSTGQLFASTDEGASWKEIASYLPPISSVEAVVVG